MDSKTTIINYCNYQERSHKEVRNKLYEIGCSKSEVEELISELIVLNLLNEERYSKAIVSGKFKIKKWGRKKIIQLLKQNQISDYCIKNAMKEIDPKEYEKTIQDLLKKKWKEIALKDKSMYSIKAKTYRYLLQKGFESDIINDIINEISSE